jgi:hypothetical protein
MLAGLRGITHARQAHALLTAGSTRIILILNAPDPMLSGRNMSRFDVATDQMGEARHTAMTHVKSPSG